MKVVLLGPYPPPHGGVQTNLVAIRRLLRARGMACSVINLTRFRTPKDSDGVYCPRSASGVLRLLLQERYDVMHLHIGGAVTLRLLILALVCSAIPWSKTILTLHSGGYPLSTEGRSARRWSLRGFIFRRLDAVIAVNEAIADLFKAFGVEPSRIHLIAPHVGSAPVEHSLPISLRDFLSTHEPVLLTVGGLEHEYDLPVQLEALPALVERFPRLGLLIIGAGSLHEQVQAWIRSHHCADHIMLCGDVPHDATLAAISRCAVLLRTTWYDGDSIAVREALHYGKPVIATDNGMRPPGVDLIPMSDARALGRRIEEVLLRPRCAASMPRVDERNIEAVLRLYSSLKHLQRDETIPVANARKRA